MTLMYSGIPITRSVLFECLFNVFGIRKSSKPALEIFSDVRKSSEHVRKSLETFGKIVAPSGIFGVFRKQSEDLWK